jgi:hypothetical protein
MGYKIFQEGEGSRVAYLHGHYSVIYRDLFGEKVSADGGFVACAELLVDLRGVMKTCKLVGPLGTSAHALNWRWRFIGRATGVHTY